MRLLKRVTLSAAVGVLAAGVTAASAAAAAGSPIVGHVYVNDNTAGANTIAVFDRHANGTLTPTPGSPFPAGGAGTGAGIASQGALELAGHGRYLLAVDAGSNQISVLRVGPGGAPEPVRDGVVSSGGSDPVSVAVHGRLVYVANAGSADSNYTGFRLGRGGHLRALPGSTFTLPSDAQPGDVLFNRTGTNLVGARINTSQIDSFGVGRDGLLTPAAGSPFPAQGVGPFGSEFSPTNPSQLFVSNAHGGAGNGTVSAFTVSGDGALSSIGASPFADLQTAPCWVEITKDGRFLFADNTAVGSISSYRIAGRGSLKLLGSTTLSGGANLGAVDIRLSPDGETLFVVDSKVPAVSALRVDGGQTTELASSPTSLPAGAAPAGIVVK